jgi:hypothetical protein
MSCCLWLLRGNHTGCRVRCYHFFSLVILWTRKCHVPRSIDSRSNLFVLNLDIVPVAKSFRYYQAQWMNPRTLYNAMTRGIRRQVILEEDKDALELSLPLNGRPSHTIIWSSRLTIIVSKVSPISPNGDTSTMTCHLAFHPCYLLSFSPSFFGLCFSFHRSGTRTETSPFISIASRFTLQSFSFDFDLG